MPEGIDDSDIEDGWGEEGGGGPSGEAVDPDAVYNAAKQGAMAGARTGPGRSSFGSGGGVGVGVHIAGLTAFAQAGTAFGNTLIALKVSVQLLETAFSTLTKGANELMGSIAKLGGARGIQSMIVESATNQALVNQARFAVGGGERMTTDQLMKLTGGLSENASSGANSRAEWLTAIKSIGVITGAQASLDPATLKFLGQLALVTGGDLQGQAEVFGRIKAANTNMSNKNITDAMLAGHAIGQTGSFNVAELPDAGKLMRLGTRIGGMENEDKLRALFAVGTIMKGPAGVDLQGTGVLLNQFLVQARKSAKNDGNSPFKFDPNSDQLMNFNDALIKTVNTPAANLDHFIMQGRSGIFVDTLRSALSEKAGVSPDDMSASAKSARGDIIRNFEKLGMTMEEFQKEVEESITPQTKFKAVFNQIADELEAKFLDTLKQMQPVLEHFADTIISNKDQIGDYFTNVVTWLQLLVSVIPDVITMFAALAQGALNVTSMFAAILGKSTSSADAQSKIDVLKKEKDEYIEYAKHKPNLSESGVKEYISRLDDKIMALEDTKRMYQAGERLSPAALAASRQQIIDDQAAEKQAYIEEKKRQFREEGTGTRWAEEPLGGRAGPVDVNISGASIDEWVAAHHRHVNSVPDAPKTSTDGHH